MSLKKISVKAKEFHKDKTNEEEYKELIISYDCKGKLYQTNGIQMLRILYTTGSNNSNFIKVEFLIKGF